MGFLAYCLVALVYWRPIWRFWRQRIAPDTGDPLFNLAVLDWVKRQIRLGLPDLYGADFFHPLADPLLLSDHLLGIAAQALALDQLTGGNAIATYNLLVFLAFPLSGIAAAAVGRAAGLSRLGAFTAGAVYAFAPYHWSQLSHLQVLSYQWIPPLLWSFDRLLVAPRPRRAMLFLLFYVL
ncbi:MAG TPA: hypothetical protein VM617_08455, partial [Thermoanaerobaculia bacterium]|nr:hypothetical protein [Thermoanaerobaculia bacterium]